ncbi:hypothetical protein HPULCUR_009435 [Helicostylum pulchrum]|uniref:Vacuolar protein sorting-associated protein 27 n=1 Tax=Helicostylum pulchrum TaxID=562976 RepID=A0ABP9YB10_9FUNG
MSWWGPSPFDEVVEKATSELLPGGQEDLVLNLDISDQIRSKKVNAKEAMQSFKRRLAHKNPNVQLATLSLVDTCVKNGGDIFVREIASREFMDELVSLLKAPTGCNVDVKNKITSVIQTWGLASKNKPVISYMYDTYALLKAEGVQFPAINENIDGILLETSAAPEWSDSNVCDRCRTSFTLTNRKHHCRKCGGTFCQQCSAKVVPLPQLGIHEPVRVCDGCYIKLKLEKATSTTAPIPPPKTTTTAATTTTTTSTSNNAVSTEEFDDDIKKAIELSLKEAEQQKSGFGNGYVTKAPVAAAAAVVVPEPKQVVEEQDEDLAAAIAASLRDIEISKRDTPSYQHQQQQQQQIQSKNELTPVEMENILLFSTLMDRVYASGGDISNDRQINQLYTQIGTLQPKLVSNLDEIIRKRNQFIEMHEKLNMAVKAYDRLLEERISSVSSNAYIPVQQYQQQPLYHQQQQQPVYPNSADQYYQTSAPPQESYYQPPNDPYYQQNQVNNQDMSNYYSAPPHYQQPPQDPHYPQQQQQQQQHQNQQPQQQEQKKPVDEAPLIEL